MKKTLLSVFVFVLVFSLASCKGDNKAKEQVKKEAPKVEEKVKEVKEEVKETATEAVANLSDQAKKGFEVMESFKAEKCSVCHDPEIKKVGPSWKDIAKVYKEKKGNIVKFLKGNADAIVDPPQFGVMQPNLNATKKLSGDDLAAIAAYIRSFE